MRRTVFAVGAALVLLTAAGSASALKPVRAPVLAENATGAKLNWKVRPSLLEVERIAREYSYSSGAMTVECLLDRNGRPADCAQYGDTTSSPDFARFAGKVAGMFKASSKDSLGAKVLGRKVHFKFEFGGESNL
jgi:hypothetical protein